MAVQTGIITLTASAQAFHTALGVSDAYVRMIAVQPEGTNNNPCYIGGSAVSTTTGLRLPAGDAADAPPAPFQLSELFQGQMALSDLYALGTAAEILRVFWLE